MKELIVGEFSDSLFPIIDGVGFVAQNYSYWLNEKYGKAYVVGPEAPNYVETDPQIIRFPTIPIPGFAPYRCGVPQLGEFRKRVDEINFDLVHVHSPFISANEALRVSKKKNIPIVATFQSKYRDDFTRIFHSKTIVNSAIKNIVKFYNHVDEVWAPNESTGETLLSYGYKKDVKIIPNGTDMRILSESEIQVRKTEIRNRHQLSKDDVVLLYVGQHRFEKNLRLVIEGLSQLNQKRCNVKALFIGTGPDEKEMKNLVIQYGLQDKVIFVGIIKGRDALQSYYAAADALMFPSMYDTASLTMREAASCAVPSIVVEGSTTAKGVVEGVNGFLIKNNVDSFASKVQYLHSHLPLCRAAGLNAQETIFVPWSKIVDDVYEGYCKLIDEKRMK
jgi:glycosyltransferase involved in cell wall biosynthesis